MVGAAAAAGVVIGDFAFANDDERFFMNAVLPRIQPEVNTAPQEPGLQTGLAISRDDLAFAQRAREIDVARQHGRHQREQQP